jgi:hypothetical protein
MAAEVDSDRAGQVRHHAVQVDGVVEFGLLAPDFGFGAASCTQCSSELKFVWPASGWRHTPCRMWEVVFITNAEKCSGGADMGSASRARAFPQRLSLVLRAS